MILYRTTSLHSLATATLLATEPATLHLHRNYKEQFHAQNHTIWIGGRLGGKAKNYFRLAL